MSATTASTPVVRGSPIEPNAFGFLSPNGVRISCET